MRRYLSEYDRRRPMTPTGTNLLGLVKHLAGQDAFLTRLTTTRRSPIPNEVTSPPNLHRPTPAFPDASPGAS